MKLSENSQQFITSFFHARSLITGSVKKSAVNKAFDKTGNTLYADLGSVFRTITPAMDAHDLIPIQSATMVEGGLVEVSTIIMHSSGESAEFISRIPLAKQDAQGYGSAFTYARRYSLMGIFGLVPADDDGNASRKTAKDTVKGMDEAADLAALESIMTWAKGYFKDDATSLNVVKSHYDKLKADKQADSAVNFNALKPTPKQQKNEPSAPVGEDVNPVDNF